VNMLKLSWRMLRRDWRAGELTILLLALLVATASVTTVGFFAERVQRALNAQANEMLGADLVMSADHVIPTTFEPQATKQKLQTANTLTFPSMVSVNGQSQLADIKAVTAAYPLRGKLRVTEDVAAADRIAERAPAKGEVWVAERLLAKLNLKIGNTLNVGRAPLKITSVITKEPDNVLDYFNIAPRVMISMDDVPTTQLVQTGSRVSYRLLVAGTVEQVEAFRNWAQPNLARGERIEGIRDARPEVRSGLERAQQFLGLASLLSVILAAVAVALAARRFMQRHLDSCAMLRCLGASQSAMFSMYLFQFIFLAIIASLVGCAVGYGAQFALAKWLGSLLSVSLSLPTLFPAWQGFVTGFVLLLGFAVPPLLRLRQVSTLRVIRREVGVTESFSLAAYGLGFAAVAFLIVWKAGDLKLGLISLGGFSASLLAAGLLGWALISLLSQLRTVIKGPWRYGLANMRRRAWGSLVQMMGLALGIMALLLLTLVRGDLMQSWQNNVPAGAPNRFVVGIQPDQLADVRGFFAGKKLTAPEIYPMVRARLVEINNKPVVENAFADERSRRLVEREFNLSWAKDLRSDNKIVEGKWWNNQGATTPQLSMEEGIAKALNIGVGDALTYDVAGTRFTAAVTSLRKLEWDSFKPNFFVIASPGVIDDFPASWMTSFHLPSQNHNLINELINTFPNLTVIDTSAIMQQVRSITDQVASAVEFVFVFTLIAGLVVLYAAITATQDERIFEGAIMRTLGGSRRQLTLAQLAEFSAIGLLAGTIAAIGAMGLSYVLSVKVLNLPYHFSAVVPVVGMVCGAVGVALAGLLGTRRVLSEPPLLTIRNLT
jgi:putative ABC transport system permease protein